MGRECGAWRHNEREIYYGAGGDVKGWSGGGHGQVLPILVDMHLLHAVMVHDIAIEDIKDVSFV